MFLPYEQFFNKIVKEILNKKFEGVAEKERFSYSSKFLRAPSHRLSFNTALPFYLSQETVQCKMAELRIDICNADMQRKYYRNKSVDQTFKNKH